MKFIPVACIALLTASCASQQTYKFYQGPQKLPTELSTIKPKRPFAAPGIYVRYVDGKYISEYESMAGYPATVQEANMLKPLVFQVEPGPHRFNVGFTYTDVANKFATVSQMTSSALASGVAIGSSKIVNYRQFADIEVNTKANKVYQLNYQWDEKAGVTFYVDECDQQEKACKKIPAKIEKQEYTITPGLPTGYDLLAK
ncbi:hypothetical protein [uncultured Pseudoteredinibacter sp.]|uniref:hypothetical protein n=1 Tax=uncultured Pseudoteredinibacter sp. TaxID=1641701 RepID=UPI0026331FD1|nr:hypothetical protein [uncultured Pseudoteredinibacter sp.]